MGAPTRWLNSKQLAFAMKGRPFREARWLKLFATRRWALLLVHWSTTQSEEDAG